MYGTWRYKSKGSDPNFLKSSPVAQKACNHCRAKKVKCTGKLSGCDRCEALDIRCVYAAAKSRNKRETQGGRDPIGVSAASQEEGSGSCSSKQPSSPSPAALTPASAQTLESLLERYDAAPPTAPRKALSECGSLTTFTAPAAATSTPSQPVPQWPPAAEFGEGGDNMELHDFLTPVVDVEFPGASSPSVTDPWCSISSFVMDCFASPHGEALFNAISNSPNTITSKNIGPPAKPTNATTPESTPGSAALHLVSNLSDPRDPRSVRCQSASENSTTASVTSGSLTPSPSASASSSGACKCLQRGIFLLDDLESLLDNTGCRDPHAVQRLGELHSALGSHKEAVKYAASMVQCAACSSRAESRILLSLLADRLILLCEKIVAAYLDAVRTWDETTPLPPDLGFNSGTNNTSDTAPRGSGAPRNGGACSSSSSSASQQLLHTLFFGEYEIDSPDEWSMLMGNLIKLQLRALHSLVGSIARSNQTRIKLEDAAGKITSLLHSLQQRPFLSAR